MAEHPHTVAVALRDQASGRYLGAGASWSDDAADALVLDATDARAVIERYSCEPASIVLVPADQLDDRRSRRAVA